MSDVDFGFYPEKITARMKQKLKNLLFRNQSPYVGQEL